jgi:hypothetical protein
MGRGTDRRDCVVTTSDSDAGGDKADADGRDYRAAEFGNGASECANWTAEFGEKVAEWPA